MKKGDRFSIQQREEGKRIICKAIEKGIMPKPTKCSICGQTEGILEYYITDFRPQYIIHNAKSVCWRCHRMLLLRHDFKEETDKYFEEVKYGKVYPPIYENKSTNLSEFGIGSIYLEIFGVDKL